MQIFNYKRFARLTVVSLATMALAFNLCNAQSEKADSVDFDLGKAFAKIFDSKVSMDIDTTFFTPQSNSFYLSEEHKALIMTMVVPQTFEKAEAQFDKESKKEGFKLSDKGKLQHNGKTILYQKGTMKKDGKKAGFHMYAVAGDENNTIFISGIFMREDEKLVAPQIETAALSAKLLEE